MLASQVSGYYLMATMTLKQTLVQYRTNFGTWKVHSFVLARPASPSEDKYKPWWTRKSLNAHVGSYEAQKVMKRQGTTYRLADDIIRS